MFGQPTQPAAKGPAVLVDGDDSGTRVAEEGPVGEDEAEVGEVLDEGAGLGAEDFARDAAAVEAEDAGFVEVVVVGGCAGGRGCHGGEERRDAVGVEEVSVTWWEEVVGSGGGGWWGRRLDEHVGGISVVFRWRFFWVLALLQQEGNIRDIARRALPGHHCNFGVLLGVCWG